MTPAQLQTLKTDLAANNNTVVINGTPTAIKNVPQGGQNAQTIAAWYALDASPAFAVFRPDVPPQEIFDQVTWANFTPADAPDTSVAWSNRSLACQGKQLNLQILLQGQQTINAARVNIRAGLNDATTNLPSGASGASRSGGWSAILPILRRNASNAEKLFAAQTSGVGVNAGDALGASTNPGAIVVSAISADDIIAAWAA